jgi:broad specificity phosphatase PhoE
MNVETIINTIRHAHTSYNAEKRYAGSIDISLNEIGIRDSLEAAQKLRPVHFDVVITSTLKRSIETAQILVGEGVPIVKCKLCNERNFGILEGLTWNDVQTLDPKVLLIEVGQDLHTVNPKGGESFEDLWQRAKKFRRFIFNNYKGLNILVVSHGVFMQMFHGVLRGLTCIESLADYPSNLELTTFRFCGNKLVSEKAVKQIGSKEVKF